LIADEGRVSNDGILPANLIGNLGRGGKIEEIRLHKVSSKTLFLEELARGLQ
jgi:hypothetical protein